MKLHDFAEKSRDEETPVDGDEFDFGYWPEIFGVVLAALIMFVMLYFAQGMY